MGHVVSDTVVKFKSENTVKPRKFRVSESRNGPVLEITNTETLIIKKFLHFIKKDVLFQMNLIRKANLPQDDLNRSVYASAFLIEYIDNLLLELNKGQ